MGKCVIYQNYMECDFPRFPGTSIKEILTNSNFRWIPERQCWQGNIDQLVIEYARIYRLEIINKKSMPQNNLPVREVKPNGDIIIHGKYPDYINKVKSEECNFNVTVCSKFGKQTKKLVKGIFVDKNVKNPDFECDLCFINDTNYKSLKENNCIILDRVSTFDDYQQYLITKSNFEKSNESLMRQYGYTAGIASNLSDEQRHAIIDNLTANAIKTPEDVIDFLYWVQDNCSFNARPETKAKWKEDITYVREKYNIPEFDIEELLNLIKEQGRPQHQL